MGDLKMLEYLYVASPKKHALENCRFLSGLERLREIGIEGSLVDVTALASGLGNRSLVYLSLKDSDLVGHLGAFEGLDGVRGLSLEGTNIDDRSLEHVAEMESLEALRLDRTGVSDAGLRCLYRAARLMAISLLDMPGVTDAGVNGLKAAKPKARVVFGGIHTGD